jgi:hypothetical protein
MPKRALSNPEDPKEQKRLRDTLQTPGDTASAKDMFCVQARQRADVPITTPGDTAMQRPSQEDVTDYMGMLGADVPNIVKSLKKGDIPLFDESWEFTKLSKEEVESKLNGIDEHCKKLHESGAMIKGIANEGKAESKLDNELRMMKEALADNGGVFDTRGVVGQIWQREKAADVKLAAEYAAIKGRANQQEFRKEWLQLRYKKKVETREYAQSYSTTDFSNGVYRPIKVIYDKEGGDSDAAAATRNLVLMCIALGGKWLSFNKFTRRMEYMHLKRGINDELTKAWTIRKTQVADDSVVDDGGDVGDGGGDDGSKVGRAPSAGPEPSAKAKAKLGSKPKPLDKDKNKANQSRKDLEAKLQQAAKVKAKYLSAVNDAICISDAIAKKLPDWKWASNTENSGDLKSVAADLAAHIESKPFLQDWRMKTNIQLKKEYDAKELMTNITDDCPEVEKKANALQEEVERLKNMRAIKMSGKKRD